MKRLLLLLCLTAPGVAGMAQDDTRAWMPLESRIGLAIGMGTQTFLDSNTSPLVYQSKAKNIRVFYQLESNDVLINFDIDLKVGGLNSVTNKQRMLLFEEENYKGEKQTKKFPAGGSFLSAKVSLGGYYKIKSTQESTFKVAVGFRLANEMFYTQGWTTGGLMNALTLAPQAITQHRVNEFHKFSAAVRLPIIAYVTRPPYHNSVSRPNTNHLKGFLS